MTFAPPAGTGTGAAPNTPAASRATASPASRLLLGWALTTSTRSLKVTTRRSPALPSAQRGEEEAKPRHQEQGVPLTGEAITAQFPIDYLRPTGSQWESSGIRPTRRTSWGPTSLGPPPSSRLWGCTTTNQTCSTEPPTRIPRPRHPPWSMTTNWTPSTGLPPTSSSTNSQTSLRTKTPTTSRGLHPFSTPQAGGDRTSPNLNRRASRAPLLRPLRALW